MLSARLHEEQRKGQIQFKLSCVEAGAPDVEVQISVQGYRHPVLMSTKPGDEDFVPDLVVKSIPMVAKVTRKDEHWWQLYVSQLDLSLLPGALCRLLGFDREFEDMEISDSTIRNSLGFSKHIFVRCRPATVFQKVKKLRVDVEDIIVPSLSEEMKLIGKVAHAKDEKRNRLPKKRKCQNGKSSGKFKIPKSQTLLSRHFVAGDMRASQQNPVKS